MGIREKIVEKDGRNLLSRLAHAKNDKDAIIAWKLDLIRILQVFNVCPTSSVEPSLTVSFQTELTINTHVIVSDIHRDALTSQGNFDAQYCMVCILPPMHQ